SVRCPIPLPRGVGARTIAVPTVALPGAFAWYTQPARVQWDPVLTGVMAGWNRQVRAVRRRVRMRYSGPRLLVIVLLFAMTSSAAAQTLTLPKSEYIVGEEIVA